MDPSADLLVLVILGIGIVALVAWALLGPRRRADESGHHVDLAEQTRRRDVRRRLGGDDEGR
ncbi:MAG: hypothetical protein U5K43_03500 [Halofilum sp. (in: g-proteobacteria)]|nr:hypothetical protein [Halofilum sp. (in: g-proteobacteria)]